MIKLTSWFVIVISIIYFLWKSETKHYKIVVGILSSQSNNENRNIIRTAFRKHFNYDNVLLKFIVAKHACNVPIEKRINVYECESFIYHGNGEHFFSHSVNEIVGQVYKPIGPVGFDFDVHHDVMINKIGFLDYKNDGIKGNVKVIVYDRVTENPVLAVAFLSFSQGKKIGKFNYKSVTNGNLTKGFKGSLVVEGLHSEDLLYLLRNCDGVGGFGLVHIYNGIRLGQHIGEFPVNILNKPGCLLGPTFSFTIKPIEKKNDDQIDLNYSQKIQQQGMTIQKEIKQYEDIVLVDTVECYRNLPVKMLKFYDWVTKTQSFDFILKSDDDCFINMTGILDFLENLSMFERTNLWIGNFREFFAIDKKGKWAEHEYRAVSYPPFACGSGYLLSHDIVQWVSQNQKKLKVYQGEDTSLGIWLSAIGLNRIQDDRFECARMCEFHIFTVPENSLSQLKDLYNLKSL